MSIYSYLYCGMCIILPIESKLRGHPNQLKESVNGDLCTVFPQFHECTARQFSWHCAVYIHYDHNAIRLFSWSGQLHINNLCPSYSVNPIVHKCELRTWLHHHCMHNSVHPLRDRHDSCIMTALCISTIHVQPMYILTHYNHSISYSTSTSSNTYSLHQPSYIYMCVYMKSISYRRNGLTIR